jgi:hypothetical protein
MGHIQFILDSRKKAQAVALSVPSASADQMPDLPGLHRREKLKANNLSAKKKEYTLALRNLQTLNKKINSLKGEKRKDARHQIDGWKAHMTKLLTEIGTYTRSETVHGFKEDGDAF